MDLIGRYRHLSRPVSDHPVGRGVRARARPLPGRALGNGVRVDVFSIGFGPELFGFNDRAGTRWKFSALPLGGYVKMHGDADATSSTVDLTARPDPDSFPAKTVWQRMAIVAAGPLRQLRVRDRRARLCCSRPSAGRSRRPRSARSRRAAPPPRPACCRATGSSRSIGEPLASFEELQGIVREQPGRAADASRSSAPARAWT